MTDQLDDELRAALAAEADGVTAAPELLDRIRSAGRAGPSQRRSPWLLAVAAAGVVAGLVGALIATGDDEQTVDVIDRPEGTTSTSVANPPVGARPTLVALVREDGWLITFDLATGEERELTSVGDPNASSEAVEGSPYYIDSVDLSPDGDWVYYSTCCEPVGNTYRIPVGGGTPEPVGIGDHPRVSPDGRYVAMAAGAALTVVDLQDLGSEPIVHGLDLIPWDLAWSRDSTQIAYTVNGGRSQGDAEIQVVDFDGASLMPADTGEPTTKGRFASWRPDGTLEVLAGDAIVSTRTVRQDAGFTWTLWVDQAGRLLAQAAGADPTPIDGVPPALAADW